MRSGDQLDRLGQIAVSSDWSVLVGVGADHVGQHPSVAGIGLGARDTVAVPVAVHRQRVDRQHPVARRDQRTHQQTPVDLDPNGHRRLIFDLITHSTGDQVMELGDAGQVVADPALGRYPAVNVEDADIVMVLGPVDSHEQLHRHLPARLQRTTPPRPPRFDDLDVSGEDRAAD